MCIRVKSMIPLHGKKAPNHSVVECGDLKRYFHSYSSIVACQDLFTGEVLLDRDYWRACSITTGRYREQFLGETPRETQIKIDSGKYRLVDLNPLKNPEGSLQL